jgi:hypothetical protein
LIAAYIINRLPSRVIVFLPPLRGYLTQNPITLGSRYLGVRVGCTFDPIIPKNLSLGLRNVSSLAIAPLIKDISV